MKNTLQEYWIGVDGTDSPFGGCTTWTASNIIDLIIRSDNELIFHDFPRLIRLNPNIPEKTRGNGALALHVSSSIEINQLGELVQNQIIDDQKHYQLNPDKLPGLIISKTKPPSSIYTAAITRYLTIDGIRKSVKPDYRWPDWTQSHIGALAAISADLGDDFTYELLAYRGINENNDNRNVDSSRVKDLDSTFSTLFSSYDYQQDRELIAPAGPDPVFCGIRSNDYHQLDNALDSLEIQDQIKSYTIFKTNQATDAHVAHFHDFLHQSILKTPKASPYTSVEEYEVISVILRLVETPEEKEGGHLFAKGRYHDTIFGLSWFEPTKGLRDTARLLQKGDGIQVTGAIKIHEDTKYIQVEFMMIIDLEDRIELKAPMCECSNRMTSAGSFAGYKCKNCGKTSRKPETIEHKTPLFEGQQVYASKSAQRHLTRPLSRLHIRNREVIHSETNQDQRIDPKMFRKLLT